MLIRFLKGIRGAFAPTGRGDVRDLEEGIQAAQTGNLALAEARFLAAAEGRKAGEALLHLARLYATGGRLPEARSVLERLIGKEPSNASGHADLGKVRQLMACPEEAKAAYERALSLDPEDAVTWNNLGVLHRDGGRWPEARACFRRALKVEACFPDAIKNLAAARAEDDDERLIRSVRERYPDFAPAAASSGYLQLKRHFNAAAALPELEAARRLGLDEADLHLNLGIALQELGRPEEAIASYSEALARDPGHIRARWHRSLALLLLGRFEEAWDPYEERLRQIEPPPRSFPVRRWQGDRLPDRTLLVHAEQGIGDEIMFASCLPDTLARVGHCVIDCHPKLAALFRRSFPEAVIHAGLQTDPVDWMNAYQVDAEIPSGSLPGIFRRSRSLFPDHRGYLRADVAMVEKWRARLDQLGDGLKVGISCRGGTLRSRGPLRSIDPRWMIEALGEKGLHLVNLQYNANASEISAISEVTGVRISHWDEAIQDYDETAALISALDLTFTVCTAVVHLAGALGKPVWVLAPFSPEWRYGASGENMAWYPSATVLRQSSFGDWKPLISEAVRRLRLEWMGAKQ